MFRPIQGRQFQMGLDRPTVRFNTYLADGNVDNDLKIILLPSWLFCCTVTVKA